MLDPRLIRRELLARFTLIMCTALLATQIQAAEHYVERDCEESVCDLCMVNSGESFDPEVSTSINRNPIQSLLVPRTSPLDKLKTSLYQTIRAPPQHS